jgi:hypothetical protein
MCLYCFNLVNVYELLFAILRETNLQKYVPILLNGTLLQELFGKCINTNARTPYCLKVFSSV